MHATSFNSQLPNVWLGAPNTGLEGFSGLGGYGLLGRLGFRGIRAFRALRGGEFGGFGLRAPSRPYKIAQGFM